MSVNKVNSLMGTFGGLNDWRVFGATPSWINPKNPPGFTSQSDSISLWITIKSILTMEYMVFSPNITWLTMSAVYLYFFPYGEVSFAYRLVVNTLLCGTYYFFFYAGLYLAGMSKRKFSPGSYPTTWNMIHNVYYWFLGVLQWTCYEYAMQKLWASDILSTPPTYGEILSDKHLMWLNCGTLLLIPIWRDFHFYSAHRFLHVRPLYRLVHSLHHRNTDPEPFSGLAMHPVEHLYYYSNALVPCIYLSGLSPLVFHFLLLHLTFAPAAGHSGFDDHFGSDQYHAIHHAKFEANYGSPSSAFLDRWFGTFRETLGKSSEYTGEWNEKQAEKGERRRSEGQEEGSGDCCDERSDEYRVSLVIQNNIQLATLAPPHLFISNHPWTRYSRPITNNHSRARFTQYRSGKGKEEGLERPRASRITCDSISGNL